jgi:predicted pyridoxine 5'-phosphate oxidase superfamily flavin-nucleotide-binding protein
MKRVVTEQSLGFVATVCPDGTANVSPKGTLAVYDDERLVFLDLHSPGTIRNLDANPSIEINVVDPIRRKGYRFKGEATVVGPGAGLEQILDALGREPGPARERVRHAVLVHVELMAPLVSPAYDLGASEQEVVARWRARPLELCSDAQL